MATIRPNDNAPAEDVTYILPTETFELGAGGSFETEDRATISAAVDHPWLEVEFPEVDAEVYSRPPKSVPYTEDPFSEYNDHSNDPALVEETERSKFGADVAPLAVESGLDQSEVERAADYVDLTLAAAAEHPDEEETE